jgi:hypothetical protein
MDDVDSSLMMTGFERMGEAKESVFHLPYYLPNE